MFDIGFFEICLIGIIALLVIGPEKLPRVARTTGLWLGKARGMVKTVKYEIDEQIRVEELKQSMERAKSTLDNSISDPIKEVESSLDELQNQLKDPSEKKPTAPPTKSAK
ncbi:Sec-independent protein translocase protein TatB [Cycloclasticus pugetii]|jgi:sec-independent protein translocase protein TatB|uniref:Sec-independent protein translocase protein TatB n=1 Tax=Cycloclasticus pugetii TaxID=34068 RepID=UPI00091643FA|nr:Sec-independent protein translocase protein TatB [Cycloclasticus pugetii]SHI96340.1 sec-independent protein translocase protein TatB [Cycloclasticus pugetii]|tara:strand:+ start:295 stop:624 length:330 start_codon:yes stop_codon:yes gene_type:complete